MPHAARASHQRAPRRAQVRRPRPRLAPPSAGTQSLHSSCPDSVHVFPEVFYYKDNIVLDSYGLHVLFLFGAFEAACFTQFPPPNADDGCIIDSLPSLRDRKTLCCGISLSELSTATYWGNAEGGWGTVFGIAFKIKIFFLNFLVDSQMWDGLLPQKSY